jgi:hypothetical protein
MVLHPLQRLPRTRIFSVWAIAVGIAVPGVGGTGKSTGLPGGEQDSPAPERLPAREVWRVAEALATSLPQGDVVVGCGDSMLPLYPDRTVLVVQRLPLDQLRPGMTVVFVGSRGQPVAHTLVAKTIFGWTTRGMANARVDSTRVRERNYMGTVVRAFTPLIEPPLETSPYSQANLPAGSDG